MPLSAQLTTMHMPLLSPPCCPQVLLSLDASQQPQQQDGSDAAALAAALTLSSPVLASLQREAALMAALRHPNCVQLFGVCTFPPAMVTGALRFWLWFGPGSLLHLQHGCCSCELREAGSPAACAACAAAAGIAVTRLYPH